MLIRILKVSVLPLGTGNDLSRVLNWGKESDGLPKVIELFEEICEAKPMNLDRWTVHVDHKKKVLVLSSFLIVLARSSPLQQNSFYDKLSLYRG